MGSSTDRPTDRPTDPTCPYDETQARLEQELEKLREVKAKGQQVKQAVNKLYRSLEVRPSCVLRRLLHMCMCVACM